MTLISSRRVFSGRVVSLDIDQVEFPDGSVGELEMFRHPGASAVLPFLDDWGDADPRIVLIRQFRHATGGYLWEIPAGKHDGSDDPAITARRELREETGYQCADLQLLTRIWTTPGFTDEVIHLYGATGLRSGEAHREPDEFLEVHAVRWSRAMAMVRGGEIDDAKTLVALLYAAQR